VVRDGVDGVLVPPADVDALAVALAGVLADPALAARLGAAGRDAALSRWDWTKQKDRTLELIEGVAR
jgi:glycosyltransferase involved in cell wall biosynthesis